MSTSPRSVRRHTRAKATAKAWVMSAKPRLRRRGLAWFARHGLPAPEFTKKAKGRKPKPVVVEAKKPPKPVYGHVFKVPVISSGTMMCTCGSRELWKDPEYDHLETNGYVVRVCRKCALVWRIWWSDFEDFMRKPERPLEPIRPPGDIHGGPSEFSRGGTRDSV